MPELPGTADGFNSDLLEDTWVDIRICRHAIEFALSVDEHTGLAERHPDMITATLASASCKRQQHAVGTKISSGIIARGCRETFRPLSTAFMTDPSDGLTNLLPARAMTKRSVTAKAADR